MRAILTFLFCGVAIAGSASAQALNTDVSEPYRAPEIEVVIPAQKAVSQQVSPFFVESRGSYTLKASQSGAGSRSLHVVLRDLVRNEDVASYTQRQWEGTPTTLFSEILEPGMYMVTLSTSHSTAPLSLRVYAPDAAQ